MNNIKIPWAKPFLSGREKELLTEAIESTWISGGPFVKRFEEEFIRLNSARFGLSTCNGTCALQLVLIALGIGVGDEVIVPGFSFAAAANMSMAMGATPVYADIDPKTWCLDAGSVREKITKKTKAIIAVHTYGNVCDIDPLLQLAEENGLYLIEDAAEAVFSKYKGKFAGTFGKAGSFSFQATKTITTGEGGFVLTPEKDLSDRMRLIRDHGMHRDRRYYWHEVVGYNFRLTNLQASVGCAQLANLDTIISNKKRIYDLYHELLSPRDGITFQFFTPEVDPVVWTIAVKMDPSVFTGDRDSLIRSLFGFGIETRPGFYPYSVMPLYNACKLRVSEDVGANVLSLPSFCGLKDAEISFICEKIKSLKR